MVQTQACQIPKPVSSICLAIDGFLLMIEGPASPLGLESLRPQGVWTLRNTSGGSAVREGREFSTKHGIP